MSNLVWTIQSRRHDAPDVRTPGARHCRLRTREVEGVRRDVHRAEEPVLSRSADRGRAGQDQRAAEKMPELENRTRGFHRGSVALNLTNRLKDRRVLQ